MKLTITRATGLAVAMLLALPGYAQQQGPRRPAPPMLTSEDVLSPGPVRAAPEESVSKTTLSGTAVRNPKAVIESALTRMSEVRSLRTRLQTSMPDGQKEIFIESVKPDRLHVTTPYGEAISIGRKFYLKGAQGWQVSPTPGNAAQSDAGFDFRAFVRQLLGKSSVRVTGQVLGSQPVDGVDTVAYEFAVTDGAETGSIQLCIGKGDGFMRRMTFSGGGVSLKIWFTSINEDISIEPPV